MSSTEVEGQSAAAGQAKPSIAMKLEVVAVPVADVDRAKDFYVGLGWRLDADIAGGETFRVVQVTPPLSDASIQFGKGITSAQPGSIDTLLLAVEDVEAARDDLLAHGATVSEVFHGPGAGFRHPGPAEREQGPDPEGRSYVTWATFDDPDGNTWLLQEIKQRLPGRLWDEGS